MDHKAIEVEIERIQALSVDELRSLWRTTFKRSAAPLSLSRQLLVRMLAWRVQERAFGGHDRGTLKALDAHAKGLAPDLPQPGRLKSGTVLIREYKGVRHTVIVEKDGFSWEERTYKNLTVIARVITGVGWNGPRFFGLREIKKPLHRSSGSNS